MTDPQNKKHRPSPREWLPRFLSMLICAALLMPGVFAAGEDSPQTDADGFLLPGAAEPEYVFKDPDQGRWIYRSESLYVSIERHEDKDAPLIWFETQVKVKDGESMKSVLSPGKTPGKKRISPVKLAQDNNLVLAISDDFYSLRQSNGKRPGIIIRSGEILSDTTYRNDYGAYPNLETIALFEDGSLKTFLSKEHTAQEYLDMGAREVYAFGPILIQDGQLGPHMADSDYYHYREPRMALGMIAPGHYLILTALGRRDDSRGAYMPWMADKMLALGAQEALNLDGGGSVALVFMGEILNRLPSSDLRNVGSLIGFGSSALAGSQ